MKLLSSRDNPFFKELVKLSESSKQRRKSGVTLIEGAHLVSAYLEAVGLPERVIVSESALKDPEVIGILRILAKADTVALADGLCKEISQLVTPAGIMAVIKIPAPAISVEASGFSVLVEDIQDPGNVGSILRSAAAAGVDDVYLSGECADAWSPKVLRAAMGAHFLVQVHDHADLPDVARKFRGKVIATSLQSGKTLYDCKLTGPIAFVFGNEGAGLSKQLLELAKEKITIPMPGGTESLNAAAAAAVCLFEAVRQRRTVRSVMNDER